MMLRNRSRAVTKPTLMADHSASSQSSNNQNCNRAIPSFFDSTKFRDFIVKCHSGTEALTSPTSILDTRAFFTSLGNPFYYKKSKIISPKITAENKSSREQKVSKGIGLALVDALKDELTEDNSSKPRNGKVLFGTQLKLQIPPRPFSPMESQTCADEFGINSPISPPTGSQNSAVSVSSDLSLSEMELSEDYTCVISRGPNPRTTHIFDNRIIKSYSSGPISASENSLSYCYTCKKHLEQTKDIYIYRGEKAFCSHECRSKEIAEISEFDSYCQFLTLTNPDMLCVRQS
ncbi:hypothetical protein L6164_010073 [Bauhinia variegata]|uniref:Uncharacterized protein n=1 Tax=Bauhinia variegata TaxID=167791 RepID=A0ACB9PSE4_BAUVA|nr:hypothetical protein L6164_010073 [Bauhinia variegata]